MSWLSWLIIGGFAGWVASKVWNVNERMGNFANVVSGIVGGVFFNFILGHYGVIGINGFFEIESWITSIVGAIIVVYIVKKVKGL